MSEPIPNVDMVTIYLEQAHDARLRADQAAVQGACAIAQTYALLALLETLTPKTVTP